MKMKKRLFKKSKALMKIKNKPELMWAGAADLMSKSESDQYKNTKRDFIVLVARALKISPFGINILGGTPYVNNLGLKQKSLFSYHKGANFIYNWVKRSEADDDKAICEAKIVHGKKELTPWIAGECSPGSMKMGTLRGFQNHMAQTRAENRCIRHLDGLRLHLEMLQEVAAMQKRNEVNPEDAAKLIQGSTVSAEEMGESNIQDKSELIDNAKSSTGATKLQAVIQGIYKIKDSVTAKAWLKQAKINKNFTKEEKETVINLLEQKIKMYDK